MLPQSQPGDAHIPSQLPQELHAAQAPSKKTFQILPLHGQLLVLTPEQVPLIG